MGCERKVLIRNRLWKKIFASIVLIMMLLASCSIFFIEKVRAPTGGSYSLKLGTKSLQLINCSTDKDIYLLGDTINFTAYFNGTTNNNVILLIANSTANLEACNYLDHASCIAYSSSPVTSSGTQNQTVYATMNAGSSTTWYAKVCDQNNNCSCLIENLSWNKTFDGNSSDDAAQSVAIDKYNNVYVAGYGTKLNGTSTGMDWWIKKFWGTNGTESWNKTYDGGGTSAVDDLVDCITTDSNNSVYAVGYGSDLAGDNTYDWWIKKFWGTNGTESWNKICNGTAGWDEAYSAKADNSNNVYVVGTKKNGSMEQDWWIKKYNSNGTENTTNWNKTIDGNTSSDAAMSVAIDENSVYVVGYGRYLVKNPQSYIDWWIKKYDSNGTENTTNWNKTIDGDNNAIPNDVAYSATIDSNHNVYVVGSKTNTSGDLDWWIKKYNSIGDEDSNWNISIDGNRGNDEAYCAATDSNNNVYVVGYGTNLVSGTSGKDWAIIKFNESGAVLWNKTVDNASKDNIAYSVAIDNYDNIYVVGNGTNLNGTGSDSDWWIKKFEYVTGGFTVYSAMDTYVDDDAYASWYNETHVKTIQEGINNVTIGGTVHIWNGTYNESVELNKPVNLIGNSSDTVIIDGTGLNANGINITVNNTLVQDLTIRNYVIGIDVNNSYYNIKNSTIISNQVYDTTGLGIRLYSSNYNNISSNQIYSNSQYGIGLYNSFYNNITGNQIQNNGNKGIYIADSSNTDVNTNQICDNSEGIYLTNSNYTNITSNQINDNNPGIYLHNSNYSLIYNNHFNNSENAIDNGINYWNLSTKTKENNIVGEPYIGGNYWSNYLGNDTINHTGIGNEWYNNGGNISNGYDKMPLVISPNVTTTTPSNSTTGVSISPSISIIVYYSKSMNTNTTRDNFSLIQKPDNSSVSISFGWEDNNKTMYANTSLSYSTVYNATIGWNATDESGNVMLNNYSWEFTTESEPTPPPPAPPSQNVAPTADADGPYFGYVNFTIIFRGSGADSDGTIAGYRWDFNNDGTYDTGWLTTNTTTHTYSSAGNYTVKLQVRDDDNATGTDTATVTVTAAPAVDNPPSISNIQQNPLTKVTSNDVVTISATVTDDYGISSVILYWNDNSQTMSNSGGSMYSTGIGPFPEGTNVNYYIKATDTKQQTKTSETYSFTVVAPPIIEEVGNVSKEVEKEVVVKGSSALRNMIINSTVNLKNVNITIENLTEDEIPIEIAFTGEGILYRYLTISITANDTYVNESDLNYIKINFTIDKNWIEDNNISIANLTAYRYHNETWENLSKINISENSTHCFLEVETPGLSTFAVVGGNVVETPPENEQPGIPWIIIIGFIIAAIIILIFILFKTKLIYIEKNPEE